MALFKKRSKKETTSEAEEISKKAAPRTLEAKQNLSHVLIRPRITEKATLSAESHVYVFDVKRNANKRTIAHAVEALYKVKPATVRVANVPVKKVASRKARGVFGVKPAGKKAYVYLKKGDSIEII